MLVTSALNLDHGTNPAGRHGEAIGGLLDEFGEPIGGCRTRRGLCARARFEERRGRDLHMNGATATIMRAMGRSDRSRAIESGSSRV